MFWAFPFVVNGESITNMNGIDISEEEYTRLLNMGFTDWEIETMPLEIYNKNKDLIGEVVGVQTKYYKTTYVNDLYQTYTTSSLNNIAFTEEITEEEYNSESSISLLSNPVNTEYKKMTTSIVKTNGKYRLKNVLDWKKMPKTRSTDIIAIGINSSVVSGIDGSENAYTTYILNDPCLMTSNIYTTYHQSNWQKGISGFGVKFDLPKNSSKTYSWGGYDGAEYPCKDTPEPVYMGTRTVTLAATSITTTMYYDVINIYNYPNVLDAMGSYRHATSSVSLGSITFGITFGKDSISAGITLTPSYETKYDNMDNTFVQVLNPSW